MASNNETIVKRDGEFEITLDDNEKSKHKITMPLFYDFMLSPVSEKGNGTSISSIEMSDIKAIINVPGHVLQWKLKVIKPKDRSDTDPTGDPKTAGDDESGDRGCDESGDRFSAHAVEFVDWLKTRDETMDKKTEEFIRVIQGAEREIIIQKVEAV